MVDVPEMGFLMIDGHGDPNTALAYREAIECLYAVGYGIKFALKRMPEGLDFAVMPLESLWWAEDPSVFARAEKSDWNWTAMIMQPEPVTASLVGESVAQAAARKPLPASGLLRYERFAEGPAAQIMHIGPYSAEGPTIRRLHELIADRGFRPAGKHHEIYLGDPRRANPEKLRTVIRQPVSE